MSRFTPESRKVDQHPALAVTARGSHFPAHVHNRMTGDMTTHEISVPRRGLRSQIAHLRALMHDLDRVPVDAVRRLGYELERIATLRRNRVLPQTRSRDSRVDVGRKVNLRSVAHPLSNPRLPLLLRAEQPLRELRHPSPPSIGGPGRVEPSAVASRPDLRSAARRVSQSARRAASHPTPEKSPA